MAGFFQSLITTIGDLLVNHASEAFSEVYRNQSTKLNWQYTRNDNGTITSATYYDDKSNTISIVGAYQKDRSGYAYTVYFNFNNYKIKPIDAVPGMKINTFKDFRNALDFAEFEYHRSCG